MPIPAPAALIKRYAGRRFYDTETCTYVTLDDLAAKVEDDEDFTVLEAETSEDITPSILKQITCQRVLHG
jgi:polyhydroxyalkanoate synthesis repressor PhaR